MAPDDRWPTFDSTGKPAQRYFFTCRPRLIGQWVPLPDAYLHPTTGIPARLPRSLAEMGEAPACDGCVLQISCGDHSDGATFTPTKPEFWPR